MAIFRGDDGVEYLVLKPGQVVSLAETMDLLKEQQTIDLVPVVRCKDCQHCRLLDDGESFSCQESEMDYYAPTYSAATYYCVDGKRRDGDVQS